MTDDATTSVKLLHPLLDTHGPGWVESRSSKPVVGVSSGLSALFVDCAEFGTRVALVTGPESRLTYSLFHLLDVLGGVWLTRASDGSLRRAVTLEPLRSPAHGLGVTEDGYPLPRDEAPSAVRLDAGRSVDPDAVPWTQLAVVTHHRARAEARLGGTLERLVEALAPGTRTLWGTTEPATAIWDRDFFTAAARSRMPSETRFHVAGGDASGPRYRGWVRVSRSDDGVVEETRIVVTGAVAPGVVADALADVAGRQQVLLATAWSMSGRADATVSAHDRVAPQPVAAVIGARSVRGMHLDVEGLVRRVGGRVLGSSRTPSVLVSFDEGPAGDAGAGAGADDGAAAAARWQRFADAVDVVGADEILAAMTPPGVRRAS
ncbi:DUF6177 family protein [Frigoribacterium sp. PhB24]|uniref:DUF6177 family protein n=1 Tax=Frigoribacterium sp. PhB24 TaxID=2485204 RepID=UPI000F48F6CD|nr:DUF6177 family protein [Frigoribacterium sp. PhB24]ROS49464.1 hypothetical protein EDF50_2378 [Frigoribacterium sp. PhB24]